MSPRGPLAPWAEDDFDVDGVLYEQALEQAAHALAAELEGRAARLRQYPTLTMLLVEIQRQTAAAAAGGDLGTARELTELAMELHMAAETARRAV